jgi:hypothetical protein
MDRLDLIGAQRSITHRQPAQTPGETLRLRRFPVRKSRPGGMITLGDGEVGTARCRREDLVVPEERVARAVRVEFASA